LHEEALKVARDTVSAVRIEHGLGQVRVAARKQRVLGALTPISSAPLLFTFNGIGCTVYGRSDYDEDTRSYGMTHYFVVLFVPIFPIGRYRVIDVGGGKYSFLGRLPLRKADRWHLGIAAAAILAFVLGGMVNSSQNSTPRSVQSATRYAPSSRTSQVSSLKSQIESGRSRLAMLKTQLQPVTDELSSLNAQMERLAAELRSLDEKQRAGLRIDVNDYNAKVDSHNAILSKHRALLSANRVDLEAYDGLIKQDSVLVDQYNALLKR